MNGREGSSRVGQRLQDVNLTDCHGNNVHLSDFRDRSTLLVVFGGGCRGVPALSLLPD